MRNVGEWPPSVVVTARHPFVRAAAIVALGAALGVGVWSATRPGTTADSSVEAPRATIDSVDPRADGPGAEAAPDAALTTPAPGSPGAPATVPPLDVPAGITAPASAIGTLVAGFPTEVIPLPATSTVLSSSVSSDGRRLHISAEVTDVGSVADVMTSYIDALGSLGFSPTESPAAPGSTAVSFTRGPHALVVSARPQAEGSIFTVAGVLEESS